MTENESINGWTFEETVKTAENIMEAENNMFKWDALRHLRDFAENYKEELEQYRAIGTAEGYERAIQSSVENYNLYREYKAKVQKFEAIGTIDEFKDLKEKNTPMELDEHNFQDEPHHYLCPMCKNIVDYMQNYCEECGQALGCRLAMKGEKLWNIVLEK